MKLLLLVFLCISINLFSIEKIKIATGEYPPFLSEKLEDKGVGLKIIKEAFELEGIEVEYGFFVFSRALELAAEGIWDATATWAYKKERAEKFWYSEPLYMSTGVFFHLKSFEFEWENLDDLKAVKIGAVANYTYPPEFLKAAEEGKINVQFVRDNEINFRKLLYKRIDILPSNIDVGYYLINQQFSPEERKLFTHSKKPLTDNPTYLLFSKKVEKNKELIIKFNSGLKKLRESGKIEKYFEETRFEGHDILNKSNVK